MSESESDGIPDGPPGDSQSTSVDWVHATMSAEAMNQSQTGWISRRKYPQSIDSQLESQADTLN